MKQNPKCDDLASKFKEQRNKTTILTNRTKKKYYQDSFEKCKHEPKKMWKLINSLCNNAVKSDGTPSKLLTTTGIITNEQETCEHINKFFATIGSELANKIPSKYHNSKNEPKNLNVLSGSNNDGVLAILSPCSEVEVMKIVDDL